MRGDVSHRAAGDEEEGAHGVGVDPLALGGDHLGEKGLLGDHVKGVEEVIGPEEHGQPEVVDHPGRTLGHTKNEQSREAEGHRSPFHKGDAAAVGAAALVAEGGHQRIGDGVEDMADGLHEAHHRQDAQNHRALGDEGGQARFSGGLIEIDEVVVQHGGKEAHGKLGQAVGGDGPVGHGFQGVCTPSV